LIKTIAEGYVAVDEGLVAEGFHDLVEVQQIERERTCSGPTAQRQH
jgi:hypothetical protein